MKKEIFRHGDPTHRHLMQNINSGVQRQVYLVAEMICLLGEVATKLGGGIWTEESRMGWLSMKGGLENSWAGPSMSPFLPRRASSLPRLIGKVSRRHASDLSWNRGSPHRQIPDQTDPRHCKNKG